MTAVDYVPFVERMIQRYEGGYGWDRHDPGGPTKYGITCFDLAEHRHQKMNSMTRWAPLVQRMGFDEADAIYEEKYASACRFNDLNAGCDCVVFDFGVNSGSSRAIKYAQRIVGTIVDGILGPNTVLAINTYPPVKFINELCDHRLVFLKSLRTWRNFGSGWGARVRDLRFYSLLVRDQPGKLATPKPQDKLTLIPKAFAKAYGDDIHL